MKQLIMNNLMTMDYSGTEALNTVCSNLSFVGRNVRKIVITSCTANNGKSFTTMQICLNLAKRGKRVAMVDGDLRHSMLVARHSIETEGELTGLAHYLAGLCTMEEAIYETNVPNFFLVPEGRDVTNPITLLNSPSFTSLLDYLGKEFDLVLIDTPPIGLVIDAAEIARQCDGTVFIVEYESTHSRELMEAKRQIEQAGCQVLGCIINKVNFSNLSSKRYYNRSYYSHYYGHGNSYYYYRRGESKDDKHGHHHHHHDHKEKA